MCRGIFCLISALSWRVLELSMKPALLLEKTSTSEYNGLGTNVLYFSMPSFVDRIIVWKEKRQILAGLKNKASFWFLGREHKYTSHQNPSARESNSPRRTIKVFQLGRDLKSLPWFIPFLLSRNNFVKFSIACVSKLIKLRSIFGRKGKKKIQHITCLCDPPRPLCPLWARGLDRATLWFLLSC